MACIWTIYWPKMYISFRVITWPSVENFPIRKERSPERSPEILSFCFDIHLYFNFETTADQSTLNMYISKIVTSTPKVIGSFDKYKQIEDNCLGYTVSVNNPRNPRTKRRQSDKDNMFCEKHIWKTTEICVA